MLAIRKRAAKDLATLAPTLDHGLVHADLVPGSVMISGNALHFIDFGDGGFGFRLFEIATALFKHRSASDYPALRDALLADYRSLRPLDMTHLPLFLALCAPTYVGWNIFRDAEDQTGTRNARFIAQAEAMISEYMAQR